MIKEALEFLAKVQTPKNPLTDEVHGQPFRVNPDGTLGDVILKPNMNVQKPSLQVKTLGALVGAFRAKMNGLNPGEVVIHVVDPVTVVVRDIAVDDFGERAVHIVARHESEIAFEFDAFHTPEKFLIDFRSSFLFNAEAVKVQTVCSTVESGSSVTVDDDGISQRITASAGTLTKSAITLPAEGVSLVPWRTFREANPVESKFLLRMKAVKDELPRVALFQIDEKWKLDTVHAIAKFLKDELPDAIILA